MPAKTVIVGSAIGLHARPAAIIAEAVVNAGVPVTISMDGGEPVDAGSALMIMTLGAGNGAEVTVASDDEEALKTVVEQCSWMRAQDIELTRDGSGKNIERLLNASDTRQMLVMVVNYATDFRYDSIIVSVEASLLVRQIPRGEHSEARLRKDYIPYFQAFRSIVELPDPDHSDREADLARWSAANASQARAALDFGIQRLPALLAKNLEATQAETQTWRGRNDRKTVERAGMPGWVVEKQDDVTLFVEARGGALNLLRTLEESTH